MHGKRNWVIDIILVDVFAMSTISIILLLQLLIPYKWEIPVYAYTTSKVTTVQNIVHYLTHEDLSTLYSCKPKKREKDSKILEFTYDEAQLLMHIARAEGGDTLEGQLWSMRTIVNRLYDDSFPDNIHDIVYDDGQFEVVTNGKYKDIELNANSHIALAMIEQGWNETKDVTYFEASSNTENSWHAKNLTLVAEVEGQRYYREQ